MPFPWESLFALRPWETAGAQIYSCMVTIARHTYAQGPGGVGYIGEMRQDELILFAGIPATIQTLSNIATRGGVGALPADAAGPVPWQVLIPITEVPKGAIMTGDTVIDDNGDRYEVNSAQIDILGWRLGVTRLEM